MQSAGNAAWYALRVRSNYEKVVARNLVAQDYEVFLPLMSQRRRWSDRIKTVEVPYFPGYVLTRFDFKKRLPILLVPGVSHVVANGDEATPIPDHEVEGVRTAVESGLESEPWPLVRVGQKVRVEFGSLRGLEGWVTEVRSSRRLVVPLTLLNGSVAVEIDRDWVEPVWTSEMSPMTAV